MKKRIFAFLLSLCLFFTGCSSAGTISTYTMVVDRMPANLDPQVATAPQDILAITNTFDGLFEYVDGEIVPNVCQDYTVSDDNKTYTFSLRQDSFFYISSKEKQVVTSHDFAFALERILDEKTMSPYRKDFENIKSIQTPDDFTLVVNLREGDSAFLSRLCMSCAMPCNEEFFVSTKGAYGLSVKNTLSNGPFTVNYLADDGSYATLIRVTEKQGGIDRIRVSLDKKEAPPETQYADDSISGFFADGDITADGTVIDCSNSGLSMYFDLENAQLANKNVRTALAWFCLGMENSGANLDVVNQDFSIFTDSITLGESRLNDVIVPKMPSYMSQNPKEMLAQAYTELDTNKLENITVLVPNDTKYSVIIENINQLWQKNLGLFLTLEYLPSAEIEQRIAKGNFDIAFYSYKPAADNPLLFISPYGDYHGELPEYIDRIDSLSGRSDANSWIAGAQNIILENALCVPMCTDHSGYIHKSYFEGVQINPFGNIVNLKYATVK